MKHDFDRVIERTGTHALKWDGRACQFGTEDVLPLWVADMDFAAAPAIVQALQARAAHPVYGYTSRPDSLSEAIAQWMESRHDWHLDTDWVFWAPGVVPSLHAAVLAFSAPGDGVIVQPPIYPPFFSAVATTGRRLVENPLVYDNGSYRLDLGHLEQCARAARMLLLCSPHNPTGRVWSEEELHSILDIARRHRLSVVSDEIHHDLVYPGQRHTPAAKLAAAHEVVTLAAPSKTFNIAGLGISALIVPDAQQRASLEQSFAQLHVSANNPFSIAACEAAYRHGGAWLDDLLAYLTETRDEALDFIAQRLPRIKAIVPQGTCLLWLDCKAMNMSDAALQDYFVRRARVGLSPGAAFGQAGSGFMRLNLGAPRAVVREALERIEAALAGRLPAREYRAPC